MAVETESNRYSPSAIEPKWQQYWEKNKTFKSEVDLSKPKFYALDMFPYPSGAGLHVGHPEGYTATDIISRYKRMCGFNVLHPMGWDAYGLPAEQYAIQTGTHPAITTKANCDTFRRQIKMLGLSYDWDREIATTDQKYYKWTQWIFIRLFNTWFDEAAQKGRPISELPIPEEIKAQGKSAVSDYIASKRLAYYDNAQVWWCKKCKTVCANEEVLSDGSHEKCGCYEVERRNLKQWLLRIPLYAERLLKGLETVDWPEGIKEMQRNWIGRSTGAEVDFALDGMDGELRVYTTRPDTLFGATYMVVAPEHPLVDVMTTPEQSQAVREYIKQASLKSDLDRTDLAKDKTGVFTGRYAINPITGNRIPVWVADYVLIGYGTGAIMAVPAHDTRDFEFAKKFSLPIICILDPVTAEADIRAQVNAGDLCWPEDGEYINSANPEKGLNINGMNKEQGIATIVSWLEEHRLGTSAVNYKIRDWLFSRQRYWGEPFPVIHWEDGEISVLSDSELPLELPELENYQPGDGGESPLANAKTWLTVTDKNGRKGRRETNTMPQWAGSCWYYLRYMDANNDQLIFDPKKEKYWMPVDLYVGGAEHAVLHLLYSRFWHKVLFDLGIVSTNEPFQKLFNQGMILAYAYETKAGAKVPSDEVEEQNGKFFHKETKEELRQIIAKMSKSLKNVVNPDDVVAEFGADTLRIYEMFMGPLEQVKPWNTQSVGGVYKFLNRTWNLLVCKEGTVSEKICADSEIAYGNTEIEKLLHRTIKKVTEDIEAMRFHTAIAALMTFVNEATSTQQVPRRVAKNFITLLSPFAPHLAEELWEKLGNDKTITYQAWPTFDAELVKAESVTVAVQINGKLRDTLEVPADCSQEDLLQKAKASAKIQSYLAGKTIRKEIVVPKRLVNIVVG